MKTSDGEFAAPQPKPDFNTRRTVQAKISRAMLATVLTVCVLLLGMGLLSTSWATPTQGASSPVPTRTPSPTPAPMTITLVINLQRPNSTPPSAPWAVPVELAFYPPGNAVTTTVQHTVTLDQSGRWTGSLNLLPGNYDVRVKNLHTLRNVKRNVAVADGTTIDMGVLREGDADGDNRVRIFDFAILRAAYFTRAGDPTFDPRADFDEDQRIRISDFALLRSNYFARGDFEVTAAAQATGGQPQGVVALAVEPAQVTGQLDEIILFIVMVYVGEQPFVGMDVEIRFPPAQLQIVGVDGLPAMQIETSPALATLLNHVDNGKGIINYSAGVFGYPIGGDTQVARLRFKVIGSAARIPISFGETLISDPNGKAVTGPLSGAIVTINGVDYSIYLPVVLSASY